MIEFESKKTMRQESFHLVIVTCKTMQNQTITKLNSINIYDDDDDDDDDNDCHLDQSAFRIRRI